MLAGTLIDDFLCGPLEDGARQRVLTSHCGDNFNCRAVFRATPMSLAPAKSPLPSQTRGIVQSMRNGQFSSGGVAQNSSFVLLAVAMLAIGLDVGVARITYGVVLPAFARDLQLSLIAAGLLGTLHLFGYLLGTLALPSLNTKLDALALCRASHFVFACAMLVCGLTSVTAAAGGFFGQRQSMKRPA